MIEQINITFSRFFDLSANNSYCIGIKVVNFCTSDKKIAPCFSPFEGTQCVVPAKYATL